MEISGNSNFATSLGAERGPAPRIRNTGKKPKVRNAPTAQRRSRGPAERTQLTLTAMDQRSKRRDCTKATVTPPRESSAVPDCTANSGIDRREDKQTQADQLNHAIRRRQVQGCLECPSSSLQHGRESNAARGLNQIQTSIPQASGHNVRGPPIARDRAYSHRTPPPPNRSFQQKRDAQQLPSSESRSSWKKAKVQQERSQRRAFVRKKDNPFALYSHDPNNAESALEELALQTDEAAQTSIIPPEILRQPAPSQFQRNSFQRRQMGQGKRRARQSTARQSNVESSQLATGMYHDHPDNCHTGEMSPPAGYYTQRSHCQTSEVPPIYCQNSIMQPNQIHATSSLIQQQFDGHRTPSIARGYHTHHASWPVSHQLMDVAPVQYHPGQPAFQPIFQPVTQSPHRDWQHSHSMNAYPKEYGTPPQEGPPMMHHQQSPPCAPVDEDHYQQHAMPQQHLSDDWGCLDHQQYFQQGEMQHGVSQEEFESAFF